MVGINVGGHLSLNGKPRPTVEWAAAHGFRSMQIFASSPGAWKPPIMSADRAAELRLARQELDVDPLVIHSIYLINLASSDPYLVRRSRTSLIATMRAANLLGAAGVVTHIGSHGGRGFEAVVDQVVDALVDVLWQTPQEVDLILENAAGSGGIIGSALSELAALMTGAGWPARLKYALDTAHLFAAGWDFSAPGVAEDLAVEADALLGLHRLAVIHANDSKVPCGSRRDRHANIGEGYIGLGGFRNLLNQESLRGVPWILETPDLERRVADLSRLRALSVQELSLEAFSAP